MRRTVPIFIVAFLLLALLSGCGRGGGSMPPDTPPPVDNGNGKGNGEELPPPPTQEEEIAAWVEYSRTSFMAQSRELNGTQYLLVTYGMKSSGGYSVDIVSTDVREDRVVVTVRFTKPAPGQNVTTAIEYPYALKEIPATGLEAEFVAKGAETYVPRLMGIGYLPPVAAESEGIKVLVPAPNATVERRFVVSGVANVYEGNIQYKLLDRQQTVLVSGIGTAAMGDWQYFTIPIFIDESVRDEEPLVLQLYTLSVKDGAVQELIELPLILSE
jgi:hypothetical protein